MTQLVIPDYLKNDDLPNFQDDLRKNLGTRAQPYLSIEDDRLTLVDSGGETRPVMTRDAKTGDAYIDCVIIDANSHVSQVWYGRDYDPKSNDRSPPACWSDNGVAPSASCSNPQAVSCAQDPSGTWGCKLSVWGTGRAREGSTTVPPACTRYQKVALLIPGEDILFQLRVPPASHANLSAYNARFNGQNLQMRQVFTRISIAKKTLSFQGLGLITQEINARVREALLSKRTDALVGRGDVPRSGALPTPAPVQQITGPTPAAQPTSPVPIASSQGFAPVDSGPFATPVATTQEVSSATMQTAPAPRGRGRPRKNPAPVEDAPTETRAPFREVVTVVPESATGSGASFGIAEGIAPDPGMDAALKSMFGN